MNTYEIDTETGCWNWMGTVAKNGYGLAHIGGRKTMTAHRYIYLESGKQIPEGLELDHLCRNRRCVNPAHLEPVTRLENMRRQTAFRAPDGLCKHGHPLDGIRTRAGGGRYCKTCTANRKRKQRENGRRDGTDIGVTPAAMKMKRAPQPTEEIM